SSGNYVDLRGRLNKTDYPNRILSSTDALIFDNSYKEYDIQLSSAWAANAVSNLYAVVTRVRRRHDTLKDRNFDAWTWSVDYDWQPSGASTILARAFRDVGAVSEFSALYATTRGVSLQHIWLPSAKLRLTTSGNLSWRRYVGDSSDPTVAVLASLFPQDKRRERIKTVGLNLTYTPTNKLQFGVGWQTETRRSNLESVQYRDQTVTLSAQYNY
ncbi:MAG TPA: hypothetical protein VFW00_02555, partial [Rhodocyclaceae bacterium]|nr:hypothetical protein [Rhodocyclaceae bacterium]